MKQARYDVLDGYRGLAALAVLLYHATAFSPLRIAAHGYLAVDFFFLLSGFIVASAYERRLCSDLSVMAFMRIRLTRLYPLAMLGVVIGTLCLHQFYAGPTLALLLVTGLMLIPTSLGSPRLSEPIIGVNVVAWSLLWEIVVNLIYALSLPKLTSRRLTIAIFITLIGLIMAVVGYGTVDIGPLWRNLWGGPIRAVFPFLIGVGMYRLNSRGILPRGIRPKLGVPLLIFIFLLPYGDGMLFIDLAVVVLIFPAIISGGISAEAGHWDGVFRFAGTLSYPVYILQGGIYPLIQIAAPAMHLEHLIGETVTVALVFGYVGFCAVIMRAFDLPVQRYFRTRPSRRQNAGDIRVLEA